MMWRFLLLLFVPVAWGQEGESQAFDKSVHKPTV